MISKKHRILSDIYEKYRSMEKLIPAELKPIYKSKNLEHYKYMLFRFNTGYLPFNFSMNTKGGWISPDGTWYLKTLTDDPDVVLRSRLKDSFNYKNNLRLQAFKEGWIRFDWLQPLIDSKFCTKEQLPRTFSITMDAYKKIDHKTYQSIICMAILYDVAQARNMTYSLNLITSYDGGYQIRSYKSRGFQFFNLDLNRVRG